ncbi:MULTISPECIES: hypothetical protein [unclassified Moorena]|nr:MULTISPECIES: hypothetical protein [unclassified Moorena]
MNREQRIWEQGIGNRESGIGKKWFPSVAIINEYKIIARKLTK